ncbi:MAG: SUMF1/EgtB/PvdO family nonheme iron enzyme [Anaerolineales bacterium]|nr:SUMF1/EgtB/PvdO family nonheme iron enzyme [Anaerolineales bacterium]
MGEYRVLRGGSWYNLDYSVRSANRYVNSPVFINYYVGFRCAHSSPP